jgi:hypothetical protein
MHKLGCFQLSAAVLAFADWLAWRPEAPKSKAHSNTRLLRSERTPNRHLRLERSRSS